VTHHIRTRTRRIIADLDRARAQLDHLADDGPAILRRAEEARLDPRLQPVGAGWGPPDPVGHAVSTGLSDQLIRNANDMIAHLTNVEHALATFTATVHDLETKRLACLAATPITDDDRAKLIAENAIDGQCTVCGRECDGTRDDRIHRVTVADQTVVPMCDTDRRAWTRRPFTEPGQLETLNEFTARRRA
jgi:hypothetical protein